MERIEVAPDGWTFRGAVSKDPFVPFGTNYTPAWSGWAPDYLSAERFDAQQIESDLLRMQELGVNVCKVVFSMRRMFPEPPDGALPQADEGCLSRVNQLVDIAGRCGIRLVLTLESTWHGTPEWFDREGAWYGEGVRGILQEFWRSMAERYRGDGRVLAYSFCVETELDRWQSEAAMAAWRDWGRQMYGTLEAANGAWGTDFGSWEALTTPFYDGRNIPEWRDHPEGTDENENRTGDPFLYDYILFRETAAFRYMHSQAIAVKKVDPQALCTMGFIQWNPLLRSQEGHKKFESPIEGPEYNVREMARTFDYVGIHFYPAYPGGDEDKQFKYLELWARWAFCGKPVVLEEFNMYPPSVNVEWNTKIINQSRRYLSGWLVWAFQNVPDSDDITKVCGLIDTDGSLTAWGERFQQLAPEVRQWKLSREPAVRTVQADKRFLYTSGRYREFIDGLLAADSQVVDFELESNPVIDRLLSSAPQEFSTA